MGFSFLTDMPVLVVVALAGTFAYRTLVVRSDFDEWPLKVLVGANSPSLCPTMFSVMNSGTWRRPSFSASKLRAGALL